MCQVVEVRSLSEALSSATGRSAEPIIVQIRARHFSIYFDFVVLSIVQLEVALDDESKSNLWMLPSFILDLPTGYETARYFSAFDFVFYQLHVDPEICN